MSCRRRKSSSVRTAADEATTVAARPRSVLGVKPHMEMNMRVPATMNRVVRRNVFHQGVVVRRVRCAMMPMAVPAVRMMAGRMVKAAATPAVRVRNDTGIHQRDFQRRVRVRARGWVLVGMCSSGVVAGCVPS